MCIVVHILMCFFLHVGPMVCLHCKRGSDVKLVSLEANSLEAKSVECCVLVYDFNMYVVLKNVEVHV